MRILIFSSVLFLCCLAGYTCFCQPAKSGVLFADDFSSDTAGKFPIHWHISDVDSEVYHGAFKDKNRRMFVVRKNTEGYVGEVLSGAQPMLEPDIASTDYAGDSFKVEYDFRMGSTRAIANLYFIGPGQQTKNATVCELAANGDFFCLGMTTNYIIKSSRYPSGLNPGWHHFEAYYSNKEVKCFIDDYLLAAIEDLKYSPASIMLNPRGLLTVKNFSITKGKLARDKEAKPYTTVPTETRLFKQLPTDVPVAKEKKAAPTSNSTRLFNQLPEDPKPIVAVKKQPASNETRLFNTLPEEPKQQPKSTASSKGADTRLFNTLPEETTPTATGGNGYAAPPVHFDVNQLEVIQSNSPTLARLANYMEANQTVKLEIDGHTDSDGSKEYNLNLSHARAEEVKKRLIALGVPATRITTKGLGSSKPLKPNTSRRNKAENRRVEFVKQ